MFLFPLPIPWQFLKTVNNFLKIAFRILPQYLKE